MVNFEKNSLLVDNCIILFFCTYRTELHTLAVYVLMPFPWVQKKDYQKYKYFDCNILQEYLVQKSTQVKWDADKRGCHSNYKPSQYD